MSALFDQAIEDLSRVMRERDTLRAQRDALLAALERAPRPPMHAIVWSFDEYANWHEKASATIAAAKGVET